MYHTVSTAYIGVDYFTFHVVTDCIGCGGKVIELKDPQKKSKGHKGQKKIKRTQSPGKNLKDAKS